MGHSRPLFIFIFSSFQYTVDSKQMFDLNKLEPRCSGIGSVFSANCFITTALTFKSVCSFAYPIVSQVYFPTLSIKVAQTESTKNKVQIAAAAAAVVEAKKVDKMVDFLAKDIFFFSLRFPYFRKLNLQIIFTSHLRQTTLSTVLHLMPRFVLLRGCNCRSVGIAVASNTRAPQFESSHRQLLLNI